jgi:coenzyme F420-0:L-glutamate ligase/coenzyme F420-1:gamma-L-glutamate ligase
MRNKPLILTRLKGIKQIIPGDDLVDVIFKALRETRITLKDGDILVLAQKIVSKSEGRLVNLTNVIPTERAREIAKEVDKRPELIQLILDESNEVLRKRPGTIIVELKSGFVCANAGIDHSNVQGDWGEAEDWVLLLPEDANASAEKIQMRLKAKFGKSIGVLIIDSHGRAWRLGTIGMTIGLSGLPALVDMRGVEDLFKYKLQITVVAAADELAAAASLMMGQAAEGTPIVHVRGFPYALQNGSAKDLVRPKGLDLFR